MSADFRDIVLAMAQERPNARVSTIVALALAVENATPGDLNDAKSLGHWAARQPEVAQYLGDGTSGAGAKIHAIKELRALTNASLKQAKEAIDEVIR